MPGHPDDWMITQGDSAQQQDLWMQLNRHLDRIKAIWHEVKGEPAAVQAAITKASSTAVSLKAEANRLRATVDFQLGEVNWSGQVAISIRRELTTVQLGL